MRRNFRFEAIALPQDCDYLAPDGSEIRLLPTLTGGGLAHCTLPPGKRSKAVRHRTVEEIWYVLDGRGEVWRKQGDTTEVVAVEAGIALTIPVGTEFQFRTLSGAPLTFLIVTMPPWPGADEAVPVEDHWPRAALAARA